VLICNVNTAIKKQFLIQSVCNQHGGHRIKNWVMKHLIIKMAARTKEAMESRERLRMLTFIGNKLGFLKRKLRGRKILIHGERI
jgi:hypothetical protein